MPPTVVIVGLGEVGKPLLEIIKSRYRTFAVEEARFALPRDVASNVHGREY